jgi:hypothetical protein
MKNVWMYVQLTAHELSRQYAHKLPKRFTKYHWLAVGSCAAVVLLGVFVLVLSFTKNPENCAFWYTKSAVFGVFGKKRPRAIVLVCLACLAASLWIPIAACCLILVRQTSTACG